MLISHRDLNFTDLRFKGGNNSYKSMTTQRLHTQTRSIKHSNDMYDPGNMKCLFKKIKYGELLITSFNLNKFISQGSAGVNKRVDVNQSYFVRQTEVYFENYYHFDRDNIILSKISPPHQ